MIPALLARRIEHAIQSTPSTLRWLERCDPKVMDAYRAVRRSLFTWQWPALMALAAVAVPIKAFRWLPVGHPVLFALFLVGLLILAWPPHLTRFSAVAWRAARAEPLLGLRLRCLAGVLWACAAVYVVGLTVLVAFFAKALVK